MGIFCSSIKLWIAWQHLSLNVEDIVISWCILAISKFNQPQLSWWAKFKENVDDDDDEDIRVDFNGVVGKVVRDWLLSLHDGEF